MTTRPPARFRALVAAFALAFAVLSAGRARAAPADATIDAGPESAPDAAAVPAMTAPALTTRAEPVYPPEALADRLEATVDVEVVISEDGAVARSRVVSPKGHGFDEAALEAVKRSVFAPGRANGVPITSVVELAYEFHLPAPPPPPIGRRADSASAPTFSPSESIVPAETERDAGAPAVQTGPTQTVTVIGKRAFGGSNLEPEAIAASDSTTGRAELSLRPHLRTEDALAAVPGLYSVQHAGGGKAQQYFLRGFDLDHGTDIAFSVDGAPINAVSHAHGQGYSDLHFIIPEVIDTLESTKGPYSARVGDFATAGSVTFHMADYLPESIGRVEVGPDGHRRAVAAVSPNLGESWRAVAAAEVFNEDGPFIHPEGYDRFNGYAKVTRLLDEQSELSLMLMAYAGTWNMSGLLPARAVCGEGDGTPSPSAYAGSHCLSRWDSVDPSQGGAAQRQLGLVSYHRQIERGDVEATAYVLHSSLQLFPNDGIAASFQPAGMQYGSQVEQDDARLQGGANLRISRTFDVAGFEVRATGGLQVRADSIDGELHRTEQRRRLDGMPGIGGPIFDGITNESELGAYAELDVHFTPWLRLVLGGREDRVDVALSNESASAVNQEAGYRGASQFSPKAALVLTPASWLDVFANFGQGFHSNDARSVLAGAIDGVQPALMAMATGYEVGATVRPLKGLSLTAIGFLLDLTSELTVDGDTDTTEPSGSTRRYGGEFVGRYQFGHGFFADAALTVTNARYTDAADVNAGQSLVPLAPSRTFSAGVGAREPIGPVTVLASAYVRSMADRPATQDGSLVATGYAIVNAQLGVRWRNFELGADFLNLGDTAWREGQFAVSSRLPGEGPSPPAGMSFTPGEPREVIGHAVVYW